MLSLMCVSWPCTVHVRQVTVDGDDLITMPGTLAAAYGAAGGHVVLMGKPAPLIYEVRQAHLYGVTAQGSTTVHQTLCGTNIVTGVSLRCSIPASDVTVSHVPVARSHVGGACRPAASCWGCRRLSCWRLGTHLSMTSRGECWRGVMSGDTGWGRALSAAMLAYPACQSGWHPQTRVASHIWVWFAKVTALKSHRMLLTACALSDLQPFCRY